MGFGKSESRIHGAPEPNAPSRSARRRLRAGWGAVPPRALPRAQLKSPSDGRRFLEFSVSAREES